MVCNKKKVLTTTNGCLSRPFSDIPLADRVENPFVVAPTGAAPSAMYYPFGTSPLQASSAPQVSICIHILY